MNKKFIPLCLTGLISSIMLCSYSVYGGENVWTLQTWISNWIQGTVISSPIASPSAGTYTSAQSISLSSTWAPYMCYTTDWTTPSCDWAGLTCSSWSQYLSPISISSSKTIKALSCYRGSQTSGISELSYTLNISSGWGGGGGGGGWGWFSTPTPTPTPVVDTTSNTPIETPVSAPEPVTQTPSIVVNSDQSQTIDPTLHTDVSDPVNTNNQVLWTVNLTNTQPNSDWTTISSSITWDNWSVILQSSSSSNLSVVIPSWVTVTWNNNWDWKIAAPIITKQTSSTLLIEVWNKNSPLTFNKPVTIEMNTTLTEGSLVDIYYSHDGINWTAQGQSVVSNGKLIISTTHFTYFIVKNNWQSISKTESGITSTGETSQTWIVTPIYTIATPPILSTTSTWTIKFSDISNSFAKTYIMQLVKDWKINGYADKTFRPNNNTTRAEFLSILMKTRNIDVGYNVIKSDFTDIPSNGIWMTKFLNKAKDLWIINWQIINGKLKFRPNDSITRAEAIAMLLRLAKVSIDSTITNSSFSDVTTPWMIPYIEKAKDLWIISWQDIDGSLVFRPNDPITRAESAKIIVKYFYKTIK